MMNTDCVHDDRVLLLHKFIEDYMRIPDVEIEAKIGRFTFLHQDMIPSFKHITLLDNNQFPHRFESDVPKDYFDSIKEQMEKVS